MLDEHYRLKRSRDQTAGDEHTRQQPRAKRRKIGTHNYPPQVWDTLSKVTLTRKALKEFDRRTKDKWPTRTTSATQRTTRSFRPKSHRLARFAELGGPDLSDLRGYADLPDAATAMSQSRSRSSKRTRDSGRPSSNFTIKTSTTGPYDRQFEQLLADKGVYPDGHRGVHGARAPKPTNFDELHQRLLRSRPSLSPSTFSESAFEDFQDMNRRTKSESKAMSRVIPTIAGAKDYQCESEENIQLTNLEKFDANPRAPQPDIYYGARLIQINERVRADPGKYLVPSKRTNLPVAPNFFLEGKSVSGKPDVAQRQAMYDGAVGARAMLDLQNYGNATMEYDGNAYCMASSYCDGQLKMYATHPRQSAKSQTEYHMTQLCVYAMTDTPDSFRQGATAYRNARDFSQEHRDRFIASANNVAQSLIAVATPSSGTGSRVTNSTATGGGSFESDTSTDELATDYEQSAKRRCGQPAARRRMSQDSGETLRR